MKVKEIDYSKLNEAVEKFGSLQKAIQQMEQDKLALKKQKNQIRQENYKLAATSKNLASQISDMSAKKEDYQVQLQSLLDQINVYSYQYELFCGFMTMVTGSPSVNDSVDTLITSFQKLKGPGWYLPNNADEMRSLFVRMVMGDYLKSFRCCSCGTKFIINKKPKYSNGYQCPVCHDLYVVKEDDSFLKALVSEKHLEDIQSLDKVLEEYEVLLPFKAFLNVPCEICHEPIQEWDDQNVKLAVEGTGYGHTHCWNSKIGQ